MPLFLVNALEAIITYSSQTKFSKEETPADTRKMLSGHYALSNTFYETRQLMGEKLIKDYALFQLWRH